MTNEEIYYYNVAVKAPLNNLFTYSFTSSLPTGTLVKVPFGRRTVSGTIIEQIKDLSKLNTDFKVKSIIQTEADFNSIPEPYLDWLKWMSNYYLYPLGQTTQNCYAPLKKAKAKKNPKKNETGPIKDIPQDSPHPLTNEQQNCLTNIQKKLNSFNVHLLHGVTGSGKTEIYLRLSQDIINQNKKVLFLIPEISLTPQLLNRFSARFQNKLAVIHSKLTPREKTNQWWDILDNKKQILLGARSALFCPMENLGLIIIDEEHESSFKQDEKLKYHARNAAIVLAKKLNIPVLLGSATPSIETWHNAMEKKYQYHSMPSRVFEGPMPEVEVIELKKKENQSSDLPFWLSKPLYEAIKTNFEQKLQSALFLNRRGVANCLICNECGHVNECPNCEISLTLHGETNLVCHYCSYNERFSELCKKCHSGEVSPLGVGTEQVEKGIQLLFPEARLARADRDEISSRKDIENLITDIENHEVDILIGTQMIAKGLDFPSLSLVGIVMADIGLHMPDFRSSERTFQLITQVSGRAGRSKDIQGKVIIQTYDPQNTCIQHAAHSQYKDFASEELLFRQELNYPPYGALSRIKIQGIILNNVIQASELLQQKAQKLMKLRTEYQNIQLLGPTAAPLSKINRNYRYHLLIKSSSAQLINSFIKELTFDQSDLPQKIKLNVDIDPINML